MKTNRIVLKAVAAAVLACTAGLVAAAGSSQNMIVTASVKEVCMIENSTTNITANFGVLDPSAASDITINPQVSYKCTKGLKPTFTVTGATSMSDGATPPTTIPFTVAFPAAAVSTGTGFSGAVTATADVKVLGLDYKDKPKGPYTGTAIITISN